MCGKEYRARSPFNLNDVFAYVSVSDKVIKGPKLFNNLLCILCLHSDIYFFLRDIYPKKALSALRLFFKSIFFYPFCPVVHTETASKMAFYILTHFCNFILLYTPTPPHCKKNKTQCAFTNVQYRHVKRFLTFVWMTNLWHKFENVDTAHS